MERDSEINQNELKKIKNELRKTLCEFRMYADRLIQTPMAIGMQNLKRFLTFIDQNLVISDFLTHKRKEADLKFRIVSFESLFYSNGSLSWFYSKFPNHEITLTHQFLQCGVEKFSDKKYLFLIRRSGCNAGGCTMDDNKEIDEFNYCIIKPFVSYIEVHLTNLQTDLENDDNVQSICNLYYHNYRTNLVATIMNEMNLDQRNSSIGVGGIQGNINTENLAGTFNEAEKQNLAEAVAEIRQVWEELCQTYPSNTPKQKIIVAEEVVDRIESDPAWKQRAINALQKGALAGFEKVIDNPGGAFIVEAIKGWQEAEVQ
jgi:hypothetical protein